MSDFRSYAFTTTPEASQTLKKVCSRYKRGGQCCELPRLRAAERPANDNLCTVSPLYIKTSLLSAEKCPRENLSRHRGRRKSLAPFEEITLARPCDLALCVCLQSNIFLLTRLVENLTLGQ